MIGIGFGFFDVPSVANYNIVATGPTVTLVTEDNFEVYALGALTGDASTTLVAGSGWSTSGFILPPLVAVVADESLESYSAGALTGDGSSTMIAGTGWATPGYILPPLQAVVADESFESYSIGTSGNGLSDGTGWNGNSVIF